MAIFAVVVLALTAITVQSAVLKTKGAILSRETRSPCDECDQKHGFPYGPPYFLRTHNWHGYDRNADGSRRGVFSGAAAEAMGGAQGSGQTFSLAASSAGSGSGGFGGKSSYGSGPSGLGSSGYGSKSSQNSAGFGSQNGGFGDGQQQSNGGFSSQSDGSNNVQRPGGKQDVFDNENEQQAQMSGFNSASQAQSSFGSGRGSGNSAGSAQENGARRGDQGQGEQFRKLNSGLSTQNTAISHPVDTGFGQQQQNTGSQISGSNDRGYGSSYDGSFGRGGKNQGQSFGNAQWDSGVGSASQAGQSGRALNLGGGRYGSSLQNSGTFGHGDEQQVQSSGSNQWPKEGFESGTAGSGNAGQARGSLNVQGRYGSSQSPTGSFGHGDEQQVQSSGSGQWQQGGFGSGTAGSGRSGQTSESLNAGRGYGYSKQHSGAFGQGDEQQVQSSGSGNWQNGGYSSGSTGQASEALGGALNLASQGLKAGQDTGCSTCGKSGYALSNAKSNSGSAIALSVSG